MHAPLTVNVTVGIPPIARQKALIIAPPFSRLLNTMPELTIDLLAEPLWPLLNKFYRSHHSPMKALKGGRLWVARDGEIVVALVHGEEATLKYLRREGSQVRLDPANAAYDPQFYRPDEVEVQGKLAGLLRRYH